jgi:Ras-related protein Rab-23
MLENIEDEVKVIIVGNGRVGKSSMLQKFCKGIFTGEYKKTIGADFLEKEVFVKSADASVKMFLWDTAGQDEQDQLTKQYYRGAACCVLAFATDDYDSFKAVPRWKDKVDRECGEGQVLMALVQTKIDLVETKCAVNAQEAEALAKDLGVRFFRISTKENFNVDEMFTYLAESFVKKWKNAGSADAAIDITQSAKTKSDAPPKKEGFGSGGGTTTSLEQEKSSSMRVNLNGPSTVHAKKKKNKFLQCSVL